MAPRQVSDPMKKLSRAAPLKPSPVTRRSASPELTIVTVCGAETVPRGVSGNESDHGLAEAAGAP